jgi:WXG100 family type VII secretion target
MSEIKFTPERLVEVAGNIEKQTTTFVSYRDQMISKARSLTPYPGSWDSAAGDAYRVQIDALASRGNNLQIELKEFVSDLRQASGIYREAEQKIDNAADGLPTDGIFR